MDVTLQTGQLLLRLCAVDDLDLFTPEWNRNLYAIKTPARADE